MQSNLTDLEGNVQQALKSLTVPIKSDLMVGIGDLHGHYPALETLFDRLGDSYDIFEDRGRLLLRKNVTFIFTGDYIDRGHNALQIISTLQKISENAPGQIVTLIGNHELLALAEYDSAIRILNSMASEVWGENRVVQEYYNTHGANGGLAFIHEFGEDYRSAFRNYVARMSKEGDIGDWMRNLKACFLADFNGKKVLFSHGDIPENIGSASGIRGFNRKYQYHISIDSAVIGGTHKKYSNRDLILGDTLFWERRFSNLNPVEANALLEKLKVDFLVVGHTPHQRITSYFEKIFDIDVGMTPKYGAREPAAIVFDKNGISAFYSQSGIDSLVKF